MQNLIKPAGTPKEQLKALWAPLWNHKKWLPIFSPTAALVKSQAAKKCFEPKNWRCFYGYPPLPCYKRKTLAPGQEDLGAEHMCDVGKKSYSSIEHSVHCKLYEAWGNRFEWRWLWNFPVRLVKFKRFSHPNEHTRSIFWSIVNQFWSVIRPEL